MHTIKLNGVMRHYCSYKRFIGKMFGNATPKIKTLERGVVQV